MQILLNHDEIMEVIQDKLQGVVEDHVRSQINIADGQELTVTITNNGGLFGATIGVQGLGSAGIIKAPIKSTNRRATKAALPPMVTGTFDSAPAPEAAEEPAGRNISDSPEDRQYPSVATHIAARIEEETNGAAEPTSDAAPVALPVIKATSIFAKAQQAAPVETAEEDPQAEAMGEAPATEPVRKSIFAFPKTA